MYTYLIRPLDLCSTITLQLFNRFTSLLYYMMAAESGFAAAQFNVAYLCEHHAVSYRRLTVLFSLTSVRDSFYVICASRWVFWILISHQSACGDITTLQSRVKILTRMVNMHETFDMKTCVNEIQN